MGVLAKNKSSGQSISKIKANYEKFEENFSLFQKILPNGAENSAKIAQKFRRKEIIDYRKNLAHLARGISMGERTERDDEKIRVSD